MLSTTGMQERPANPSRASRIAAAVGAALVAAALAGAAPGWAAEPAPAGRRADAPVGAGEAVDLTPRTPPAAAADPFPDLGKPAQPTIDYSGPPPRRAIAHYEFLEHSYFDYFLPDVGPSGDARLAFDAHVAPHLFLWNEWEKVQWQPGWSGGWINDLAITFIMRLRMVRDYSAPVRPPSYVPRIDYQLNRLWKTREGEVHLVELRITPWGHHSNGQQYCPFVEGIPGGSPGSQPCVTVDPANPPTDKVNYRSGDFSTSFFIVGGHYAHLWLDGDRWERARLAGGVLFEGNPRPWGPGTIGETMSKLYGPWRLKAEMEGRKHLDSGFGWPSLAGMLTASASVELMWKTAPRIPGDREIVEVAYLPDRLHGAGAFLRFFSGQDWMNILFAAGRRTTVELGLVWSLSPPLQYTFEPPARRADAASMPPSWARRDPVLEREGK